MIVLNLRCRHEHRFEGWFASTQAFEDQRQRGLLSCPVCNDGEVSRLPSGPRIVAAARVDNEVESLAAVRDELLELVKAQVKNSENVGERFPEEARKIHYKEVPARSIRGVASPRETHELLEEGIVVFPLPVPPSEETH